MQYEERKVGEDRKELSDKIKEAKELLGDKNAFVIAELQSLEKFDERSLKALSPYRTEDTPSYVYDRKRYRFKDFGGDRDTDIIDAYIEQGHTFTDACKFLFEKAGIPYEFSYSGVKDKTQYKYPHDENGSIEGIHKYWNRRGISDETLEYLDIVSDGRGNTVWKYYDLNDVLSVVKYRPARPIQKGEAKCWFQKGADTCHLLFNMNRVNPEKPLLVQEGEGEVMTAIEAGYYNAVSIPMGCKDTKWIEENYDFLNEFSEIIICFDSDKPGIEARENTIYRLGSWRTRYVEVPTSVVGNDGKTYKTKDLNDILQVQGPTAVLNLITTAKDVPVKSVQDYSDIDDIDLSKMDGIKSGIASLDKVILKVFYSTVTLLTGYPGSGKSSLLTQLLCNAAEEGIQTWCMSQELPVRFLSGWINYIFAGPRNVTKRQNADGNSYYVVPSFIKSQIRAKYKGLIHLYRDDASVDAKDVLESMEESIRKFGVKLLILDSLMTIDLGGGEDEKYSNQKKFMNSLRAMAKKYDVAIVLVTHPKKPLQGDMSADIGMYGISGSSDLVNLAHRVIGMRRVTDDEKEKQTKWAQYNVVCEISKDRLTGESGLDFGIYYDKASRRFYSNEAEFNKNYSWDTNQYSDRLKMPEHSTGTGGSTPFS